MVPGLAQKDGFPATRSPIQQPDMSAAAIFIVIDFRSRLMFIQAGGPLIQFEHTHLPSAAVLKSPKSRCKRSYVLGSRLKVTRGLVRSNVKAGVDPPIDPQQRNGFCRDGSTQLRAANVSCSDPEFEQLAFSHRCCCLIWYACSFPLLSRYHILCLEN